MSGNMAGRALTPKQARFVQEYMIDSNGAAAAVRAGYKQHTAKEQASRLLTKAHVRDAIAGKQAKLERSAIATAAERREWWSEVMRTGYAALKDRLRASELLGKSQGDFIEKLQVSGAIGLEVVEEITDAGDKAPDGETAQGPAGVS